MAAISGTRTRRLRLNGTLTACGMRVTERLAGQRAAGTGHAHLSNHHQPERAGPRCSRPPTGSASATPEPGPLAKSQVRQGRARRGPGIPPKAAVLAGPMTPWLRDTAGPATRQPPGRARLASRPLSSHAATRSAGSLQRLTSHCLSTRLALSPHGTAAIQERPAATGTARTAGWGPAGMRARLASSPRRRSRQTNSTPTTRCPRSRILSPAKLVATRPHDTRSTGPRARRAAASQGLQVVNRPAVVATEPPEGPARPGPAGGARRRFWPSAWPSSSSLPLPSSWS